MKRPRVVLIYTSTYLHSATERKSGPRSVLLPAHPRLALGWYPEGDEGVLAQATPYSGPPDSHCLRDLPGAPSQDIGLLSPTSVVQSGLELQTSRVRVKWGHWFIH